MPVQTWKISSSTWFLGIKVTSSTWFPRTRTVPASTRSSGIGASPASAWFSGNNLVVDVSQIDWIPLHSGPWYYHLSFLGYLGPFSSAYLLLPIPNLSPVYATAQPPGLFPRIVRAPCHLIPFGVFDMTHLWGQIVPLVARAPCLHVFFAFVPAMWTPKRTQWICSRCGLPNVL